jgi:hypothetical protein
MKVVSGTLYTTNAHAASQFRFMFWAWLDFQNYDVRHYWTLATPGDPQSGAYVFKFKLIPKTWFNEFRRLWIGNDAIYPRQAAGTFTHRDYSTGRNIDPYFVDALKYAKEHAPCVVVVESVAALEMAFDHLRTVGKAYAMLVSTPPEERLKAIQAFDVDTTRRSFLIVTKQIAMCGWRLARPDVSLASSAVLDPDQAIQILGRTARMSMPHGRVETTPHAFVNVRPKIEYTEL